MQVHFNAYKCKYEMLNKWIMPYTRTKKVKSVRIFINLDDFFHTLFKPTTNNEFEVYGKDSGKEFLSNLFNLLAHYRYWAIKNKYDVEVYGYFTNYKENFKNSLYVPEYRKKTSTYLNGDKYYYISSAINSSMDLSMLICKYIPKVYLIDTKYLEPSILPAYISDKYGEKDLNIIVSRDIYDLQYAYKDNWVYISPKGENSTFVHQGNMWDYINYKEHIFTDTRGIHYPPKLFILARSIVGEKYRNIPRLRSIGWKTLFKFIDSIQEKINDNNYILIELELRELLKGKLIQDQVLQANINTVDIDVQIQMMSAIDKTIIDNQIIDIEDFENLKMLNKIKLSKYPLNLKFLCDTVQTPVIKDRYGNDW